MSSHLTLALMASSGIVTLILFVLFNRAKKPDTQAPGKPDEVELTVFDVFERDGSRKALPGSHSRDSWTAAVYCLLFYLAVPLLIWRYGVIRTLGYIAAPLGCALALSLSMGFDGPWAAMLLVIPLRLAVGLWIRSQGNVIRIDRMVSGGWRHVGSCRTSKAALAIDAFFPSASNPRRWYKFAA